MRALLKNLLLQNKLSGLIFKKQKALTCLLLFLYGLSKGQIVNYVNNGGFEDCINCSSITGQYVPRYWNATDTGKFFGYLMTKDPPSYGVPLSSYTYQWPRHGKCFLAGTEYYPSCLSQQPQGCAGYPRNRLKQKLQNSKTYCFTMYVNLQNESTHAINSIGVYFADSSTDTIKYCMEPITYLTPQIINTSGFLSDTLNWVKISGTYTANGSEKYIMLGNFKSATSTPSVFVNPKNSPDVFAAYCYDDVSLIDVNLPAFAGNDTFFIPGDSIFLGRPPDVGIDDDCFWYKLPSTTPFDTVAGLWVKPVTTTTYVVKQDICGNVKYDTVVVYQSAIGINELDDLNKNIKIYPQPVQDILNITFNLEVEKDFFHYSIYNNLGQLLREEELEFKNKTATVNTNDLPNGVYSIKLRNTKNVVISKRFVVTK